MANQCGWSNFHCFVCGLDFGWLWRNRISLEFCMVDIQMYLIHCSKTGVWYVCCVFFVLITRPVRFLCKTNEKTMPLTKNIKLVNCQHAPMTWFRFTFSGTRGGRAPSGSQSWADTFWRRLHVPIANLQAPSPNNQKYIHLELAKMLRKRKEQFGHGAARKTKKGQT